MMESPLKIKNKQYLYAGLAGVTGVGIASLLIWSLQEKTPGTPPEAPIDTQITQQSEIVLTPKSCGWSALTRTISKSPTNSKLSKK